MSWYGVNHVHLIGTDVEETIEFYTEVMGFDLFRVLENDTGRKALMFSDGTYTKIYFWVYDDDVDKKAYTKRQTPFSERDPKDQEMDDYVVGIHHMAWGVENIDDLELIKENLEEYGVDVWGPINRHNMAYNLYFEDPSGNNLEIHAPGPEASTPGSVSTELNPGEAPETTDEIDAGVDYQNDGVIESGAEDGIAKTLLSSYHART